MRIAFLSLLISFFLFGFAYYFYTYESPFREDKLEEIIVANDIAPDEVETLEFELNFIIERGLVTEYLSANAYIGIISFFSALALVFFFVHLSIDKLFFKTLQDPPNYVIGARRSVLFLAGAIGYFAIRLQGIEAHVAVFAFVLAFATDYFVGSYSGAKEKNEEKE